MTPQSINRHVRDIAGLAFWILITFAVAAFGSLFEPGEWYRSLAKPTWTPPGWVFGPVWGILYLAMSVAAWTIWRRSPEDHTRFPLLFYLGQLLLNGLWSWFFFGQQRIGPALVDLLLLVVIVAITVVLFMRVSRLAGALLVPYLLWASFAAALNFQIWRLN